MKNQVYSDKDLITFYFKTLSDFFEDRIDLGDSKIIEDFEIAWKEYINEIRDEKNT